VSVPLLNASGCLDALTAPAVARSLDTFVTKTVTPLPREGNPPPRIAETEHGMLNSIGLQNPGIDGFLRTHLPQLEDLGVPLWVSVGGFSASDYATLCERLEHEEAVSAIELNLSCPNVEEAPETTAELVAAARDVTRKPLYAKLSPATWDIAVTARAVEAAGGGRVAGQRAGLAGAKASRIDPVVQTAGLVESARIDPPIFSPATKADVGHDENVTFSHVVKALGRPLAEQLKRASLSLYEAGRGYAAPRGIIIADTKFEFGTTPDGRLLVIDEILTPDSSRFWPADRYAPGRSQPSFDKQPLRDYLAGLKQEGRWDGNAPAPPLAREVVQATSERYLEAYRRITGKPLATA